VALDKLEDLLLAWREQFHQSASWVLVFYTVLRALSICKSLGTMSYSFLPK